MLLLDSRTKSSNERVTRQARFYNMNGSFYETKSSRTMYDLSGVFTRRFLVGIIIFQLVVIGYLIVNPNCSHYVAVKPPSTLVKDATDVMYGIMFDAGSTGSRVHVYKFSHDKDGRVILENELFKQVKPGLSAYAPDPKKGADSLRAMLDEAKQFIPSSHWKRTPMALKATAGLRLLPEVSANNLLNEVRDLFQKYPFVQPKASIKIMEGTDEGVFSWMTVNFLLKKLLRNQKTIGALDLGGGSTQITYVPESQDAINRAPAGFTKKVSVFNIDYTLYTHSYLGLGLMSARLQIYGGKEDKSVDRSPKSNTLTSGCLPPDYEGKWAHGNTDYIIKGVNKDRSGFDVCYTQARLLIASVDKPKDLIHQKVYLFSYYFDRAVESGLISGNAGGTIKLKNFYEAAKIACGRPDTNQPHLCTDLVYIYSLLHDGFGFQEDTDLVLAKKINDVELGWALGATFQIIPHNAPS